MTRDISSPAIYVLSAITTELQFLIYIPLKRFFNSP